MSGSRRLVDTDYRLLSETPMSLTKNLDNLYGYGRFPEILQPERPVMAQEDRSTVVPK